MSLTPERIRLDGKAAVITGAAQGIGAATARAMAAFGCRAVAICDRNQEGLAAVEAECRQLGAQVVAGVFDVRDTDAVAAHLVEVSGRMGTIDVLVNNAGGTFHADFTTVEPKGEMALVRENFLQVTDFIRRCVPLFGDEGGAVVNVTSSEAHRAAPGFATYAAMKAALVSLTKSLALELADRRIRVNCVAPDGIPTEGEMGLQMTSNATDRPWRATPLGLGHTDDAAAAVVFLAGDMARFVTGDTIQVNGGTIAAGGWKLMDAGHWAI